MRSFILTLVFVALPISDLRGEPPAKKKLAELRPVLSWSDVGRISDGGGPALQPYTNVVADPEAFAQLWMDHKGLGVAPRFNFNDYFVVVTFRESGLDFEPSGGLAVNDKGGATVFGVPAHQIATNAGWYSTTIGVFPRKGIVSVNGEYLPEVK